MIIVLNKLGCTWAEVTLDSKEVVAKMARANDSDKREEGAKHNGNLNRSGVRVTWELFRILLNKVPSGPEKFTGITLILLRRSSVERIIEIT